MDETYIYGLVDPRDGETYYVGKSDEPQERFKRHLRDGKREEGAKGKWIAELLDLGLEPELVVIEAVAADSWEEHEVAVIAEHRIKGAPLLNVAPGGNAPVIPEEMYQDPEWRKAVARRMRDHWADEEARRQHVGGLLAAWDGNDDRKAWLSEFNAGRQEDPEYRERHRQAVLDSRTDEVRESISAAKVELYSNPQERELQSERMKRWIEEHPDEAMARVEHMNEARLAWLETEEGKAAWEEANEKRRKTLKAKWADPEFRRAQLARRRSSEASRAAEAFGVPNYVVYRWCRAGKLGRKVGGRWAITEQDIERFKKEHADLAFPRRPWYNGSDE
jgi:hypothetical protein